jgi:hypothetical protein
MLLHKDDTKKTGWLIYRSLSTFELDCEFSVFLTTDDTTGFSPFSSQEAHERMDADVEESLGQLGAMKGHLLV